MEFEWGLMRNYLGITYYENAVVVDNGSVFVIPKREEVLKKENTLLALQD